jgi:hypothetical protein
MHNQEQQGCMALVNELACDISPQEGLPLHAAGSPLRYHELADVQTPSVDQHSSGGHDERHLHHSQEEIGVATAQNCSDSEVHPYEMAGPDSDFEDVATMTNVDVAILGVAQAVHEEPHHSLLNAPILYNELQKDLEERVAKIQLLRYTFATELGAHDLGASSHYSNPQDARSIHKI